MAGDPSGAVGHAASNPLALPAKLLVIAGVVTILGVTLWVRPSPDGAGTDPSLFPPCAVGTDGAVRCPTCGLTSGMSALLRGGPGEALRRNLLVPVVALLCILGLYLAGGSLLVGKPVHQIPGGSRALGLTPPLLPVCVLLWLLMQLARG